MKPENLGKFSGLFVSEVAMNAKFQSDPRGAEFSNAFNLEDNSLYYA